MMLSVVLVMNSLVSAKNGHNLVIIWRDLHERQRKAVEFKDWGVDLKMI